MTLVTTLGEQENPLTKAVMPIALAIYKKQVKYFYSEEEDKQITKWLLKLSTLIPLKMNG